jgi:hypothetical protein
LPTRRVFDLWPGAAGTAVAVAAVAWVRIGCPQLGISVMMSTRLAISGERCRVPAGATAATTAIC